MFTEKGNQAVKFPQPPIINLPAFSITDGDSDDFFSVVDQVNDSLGDLVSVTVIGGKRDEDDSDLVYPSKKSEAAVEKVVNLLPSSKGRTFLLGIDEMVRVRKLEFYDLFDPVEGKGGLRYEHVRRWEDKLNFLASNKLPKDANLSRAATAVLSAGRLVVFVRGTPSMVHILEELSESLKGSDEVGFHIVVVDPSDVVRTALLKKAVIVL